MKTLFITLIVSFCVFQLNAAVHTVSNDPNQPAQWNDLQMACDSANAGDTIYIQGTATDYCTGQPTGQIHIKKKLHLIGAGIKPQNNYLYGYESYISSLYLDTVAFISGASGTIIEGLRFTLSGGGYNGLKDIIIRRNRIYTSWGTGYPSSNLLVVNNIIHGNTSFHQATNVIFMNNICLSSIQYCGNTVIVSNNLFLLNNGGVFSTGVSGATITNNIFYYSQTTGANYCNLSNNLGFGLSTTVLNGTNTGSGNLNADPQFMFLYSTTDHSYNDQNKYVLKSTSLGKNAGTDGTDIGIYGGQYPWPASAIPDFINCITPQVPVVEELIIQNSSVPANGNLNFSIKAYKTTK
jgi:hypothetical protein